MRTPISVFDDTLWIKNLNEKLSQIYGGAVFLSEGIVSYNLNISNFMTVQARKSCKQKIAKFALFFKDFEKNASPLEKEEIFKCISILNNIINSDDACRFRMCEFIDHFNFKIQPKY